MSTAGSASAKAASPTHMPNRIVVQCQSERSQHQNRAHAFAMLRARLYEAELQRREAMTDAMNATKTDIGWGHQIRSYVLQPYQMVKDLRTGVETSNTARCSTATSIASSLPHSPLGSRVPTPSLPEPDRSGC
jgi:protein subunit release factor B